MPNWCLFLYYFIIGKKSIFFHNAFYILQILNSISIYLSGNSDYLRTEGIIPRGKNQSNNIAMFTNADRWKILNQKNSIQ